MTRKLSPASFRAALVDMDGTLYDSMPSHARAWQALMREVGVEIPLTEMFRHEGRTGAATIDLIFRRLKGRPATREEMTGLYRRKTELFAAMPPVPVMPGAQRMIRTLMDAGLKIVLVTGSGQSSLLDRLENDFPHAFPPDMRITSRNVTHGKPHPEPYLRAMDLASVTPDRCIVVENAPLGVEAGHRSGAFTVGVNTGPLDPRELLDAGADMVFDSMPLFADALIHP